MAFYSGLGSTFFASRDANGNPGVFRNVGETDPDKGVSIDPKIDVVDVYGSSVAAARSIIKRLVQQRQATVKIPFMEWSPENLALRLLGESSVVAAGTVTGETLPGSLLAGDLVALNHTRITPGVGNAPNVVIHDSNATPATVDPAKYSFDEYGLGSFSDVGTFTQPFKADYAYGSTINIPALAGELKEQWVRFQGLNTAEGVKVLIDLYRVSFDVTKSLALIQKKGIEVGEMEGMLMADTTKASDPVLGQFGRIRILSGT